MSELNSIELAKQGNPKAIAALLNQVLHPQAITAKAILKDGGLQLMLQSDRIPDRTSLIPFVRKVMLDLQAVGINRVRLYGQAIGMSSPAWSASFDLLAITSTEKGQQEEEVSLLVKQGDIAAINNLLNKLFRSQNILAEAILQDGCLQIILKSSDIPNESVCLSLLNPEITSWQSPAIKIVQIYGQDLENAFPAWSQEIQILPLNDATSSGISSKDKPGRAEFLTTFKTFQFSSIVPYKEAFTSKLYGDNTVKLLLFFSLFPWTLRLLAGEAGLERIAWLLGIYYAAIWGIVLRNLIKPDEFSWSTTLKCIIFTAFVGIPLLLFAQRIPPFSILYSALYNNWGIIFQLIGFVFGVGVLEESCKALPVYLFLLREGKLNNPLTASFYGAMSGLGFAIAEGANYSVMYALGVKVGKLGLSDYVLVNTIRLVSLPLFHAIWAGIVGYFLGLAAINPSRQSTIICIGIAISAVLHGCYNTFSDGLLGLGILAFSILLFVAYLRRSKYLVEEMHKAEISYQSWKSKDAGGSRQ